MTLAAAHSFAARGSGRGEGGWFKPARAARIWGVLTRCVALALALFAPRCLAGEADLFGQGAAAYRAGDYVQAARAFQNLAARAPSAGTLQNLGNAEWQRGRPGRAVLAWEQALWLDARYQPARNNLRYARKSAQLEAPQLGWHEVISTWLPASWWAWITGVSFWLAVVAASLPGFLRARRGSWHHGLAALGFMVSCSACPPKWGFIPGRAWVSFWNPGRCCGSLQPPKPNRLPACAPVSPCGCCGAGTTTRWSKSARVQVGWNWRRWGRWRSPRQRLSLADENY